MEDESANLRKEIARMRRLMPEFKEEELLTRIKKLIKEMERHLDEIEGRTPDETR